ncbi:MBL fold metallo-hydrolase [Blastococcus sp. URHD0036]|uniref:MBL fold metallo-hydrolase n=1 Tax=Blastococcus sp. URHD0036 TaxID=1380356 RepID=UPI00068B2512|nr:MBL fold metallo-hydrolase [Blastococcus sp. URHD0036]
MSEVDPEVSSETFGFDYSDADPIAGSPLYDDTLTTLAVEELPVGGRTLLALSDGFFTIDRVPEFLGSPADPHGLHDDLVAQGMTPPRVPVGAFVWPGELNVLVDAGFGPRDGGGGIMVGGELRRNMARKGLGFDDIDIVALSHLHPDHTGWLADFEGNPLFVNARVVMGAQDWHHFMETDEAQLPIDGYVKRALMTLADQGRVDLLEGDVVVAPGITRLDGAGHTPGHSLYLVEDGGERAILFGDAMYCPQQLTEVDWIAGSDVDPRAAQRVRERYLRELDEGGGVGLGCHFPGLKGGRVLSGAWQSV